MFLKSSRYYKLETVTAKDRRNREVKAVKLRRLPATIGHSTIIAGSDQLDVMCEINYKDASRFWHIADANSELEANELVRVVGRVIKVPDR